MKLKIFILSGVLLFSEKMFSQSATQSEFLGVWKSGSGKHYLLLTFRNDSIYSVVRPEIKGLFSGKYSENRWYYTLDSSGNGYFLKTISKNSGLIPVANYKLKMIDRDSLTMQLFKTRAYDKRKGSWYEKEPRDTSIYPLVRLKEN